MAVDEWLRFDGYSRDDCEPDLHGSRLSLGITEESDDDGQEQTHMPNQFVSLHSLHMPLRNLNLQC